MGDPATIRPKDLKGFIGQARAVHQLDVSVRAALQASPRRALPHTLLSGPAGLGKTSLAFILAHEMGVEARMVNCAAVQKAQDLLPLLTTTPEHGVLFLDEIHALEGKGCWDYMLTVLEDSRVTVRLDDGANPTLIPVELPRFTIIGATTREGRLPEPVRDRFFNQIRLEPYTDPEMIRILDWTAAQRSFWFTPEASRALVPACHETARWAVRLVEACRDTVQANSRGRVGVPAGEAWGSIGSEDVAATLTRLGFHRGLTRQEHQYLQAIQRAGKPLGVKTLAGILHEDERTIEEVTEPWLLQRFLIEKTPKGRQLTSSGQEILI